VEALAALKSTTETYSMKNAEATSSYTQAPQQGTLHVHNSTQGNKANHVEFPPYGLASGYVPIMRNILSKNRYHPLPLLLSYMWESKTKLKYQ